ncbi:MAG: DUF4347 domain-containing protein [Nitrosomonas sp.]|nr:DUF4347 domain-containing protein [Nitrosomonas sp.]MDP1950418.1 DUF4347 domain-containing protein [Nitrosomonas sp.]
MTTQAIQPKQAVLFIDSGVADYQTLIEGIKAGTKIVILNANQDGILQIAEILSQHSNVDSVQILSHGNQGQVYLGNATLSQNTLGTYQSALQTWGHALSETADILFYGCHVAKGAVQ